MKRTFVFIMLIMLLSNVFAQEKAYMIGIGRSSQLDTYLSPEHYSGLELRFINESTKMHSDSVFSHTWQTSAYVANTSPRVANSSNLTGMLDLSYGLHYNMVLPASIHLAVGADVEGFVGGIYNTRNGNNPAQLKAGMDISPSIRASYDFRLFRRNLRLNYQAHLPLVGLQFSPAYGQSYYELFTRGNYDHNICFTSPLNALSLMQIVSVDIPFMHHYLRVGYLGDYRQAELNSLKYHHFTHTLVIGWRL